MKQIRKEKEAKM